RARPSRRRRCRESSRTAGRRTRSPPRRCPGTGWPAWSRSRRARREAPPWETPCADHTRFRALAVPRASCVAYRMARVALITGGAKGTGRGVARALGARGDRVAIAYRTSAAAAAETVAAIEAAGGRGLAVAADVADPTQAERLVAQVAATFGPPDVLVHAAGPYHRADVLAETPAGWREMIGGDLGSLFFSPPAPPPAAAHR